MQAWKYQPWVQEAINKRLNKLADVAPPTVGFHVRGGDKLAEDKMLVNLKFTRSADLDLTSLHDTHIALTIFPRFIVMEGLLFRAEPADDGGARSD